LEFGLQAVPFLFLEEQPEGRTPTRNATAVEPLLPCLPVFRYNSVAGEGAGRIVRGLPAGGKDAMHALGGRIRCWFGQLRDHPTAAAVVSGVAIGLSIACLLMQIAAGLGMTPGIQIGLWCGWLLGVAWGRHQLRTGRIGSPAMQWLSLAILPLLWPAWMMLQLDAVSLLPTSIWAQSWTAEVVGVALGIATFTVPCGLWTGLLSRGKLSITLGSAAVTIAAVVLLIAPFAGVFWPAQAGFVAVALWIGICRREVGECEEAITPRSGDRGLNGVLAASVVGVMAAAMSGLASELFLQTPAMWLVSLVGVMAGVAYSRLGRFTVWTPPMMLGSLVLLVSPWLIDAALWTSGQVTTPWLLDVCRGGTLIAVGLPIGWSLGRSLHSSATPLVGLALFAGGFASGAVGLSIIGDPLPMMAIATFGCWVGWAAGHWQSRPIALKFWGAPVGVFATGIAAIALGHAHWDGARAGKLLFSTTALLGQRSGWTGELLTQLDDIRPVHEAVGSTGRWTLWQSRGGVWQVRKNGVPLGSLTVHPEWIPQYPSEVCVTVWPLVLVDQPARILAVGAGSGAGLQGALAFPIRELVCVEPDGTLVDLIRGPLAEACGRDPFADDRVVWRRQPLEWMAGREAERFDVIAVSTPPPVTTGVVSMYTAEFYQRAASQLTETGLFCQRFSAIDFGPRPLMTAACNLAEAFPATACLEVGMGEYLLIGAKSPSALVRRDLPQRLETPHMAHVLSRCQWDWSMPLNFAAFDRNALQEVADELGVAPQHSGDFALAFSAPRDLLRWGLKQQETVRLMTAARTTPPVSPLTDAPVTEVPKKATRASRYLDWIGPKAHDPELLRRLSEVAGARKLVSMYPDTYWWEYRKELREQLQDHPRTGVQPVAYTRQSPDKWHLEDRRRKVYFERLGEALQADRPTREQLDGLETLLEPADPLLTLFAHQELADLYARGDVDPARELAHRLHVIYFAPPGDCSVRNVVSAIDHVVTHPEALPNDSARFDTLNGLLQTLRMRWEGRTTRPSKSAKVTLQEIERSLLSVERAVETMEPLAATAGLSTAEWSARKTVLERILIRPFRGYRDQLVQYSRDSQRRTAELLQRSTTETDAPSSPQKLAK
jgi:hypothetical protein